MSEQQFTYEAFISYRHVDPDQQIAKKLHSYIENYRIPAAIRKASGKKRMGRVFRDQEELPLSADLGGDIERALSQSKWLIVVCSPELLRSRWCLKEIDTFIALGREKNIHVLAILTRGEPAESFPEQLRFIERDGVRIEVEPLAADIRADSLPAMFKKLRSEKLRLLAPMLGVTYDELRRRARERRLRLTALVLAGLLALSAAFTAYALHQRNRIAAERDAAQRSAVELLIEKSARAAVESGLPAGAAYALDAYDRSRDMDGAYDASIAAALSATLYPAAFDRVAFIGDTMRIMRNVRVSPDGRYAAATLGADEIAVFDLSTAQRLYTLSAPNAVYTAPYRFSDDSMYFLVSRGDGATVCDAATGLPVGEAEAFESESRETGSAVSSDGALLAEASGVDGFTVSDASGNVLWSVSLNCENTLYTLRFFHDDQYLLASNGYVNVYDAKTGETLFSTGDERSYGCALTDTLLLIPYRSGGLAAYLLPGAVSGVTRGTFTGALYIPQNDAAVAYVYTQQHVCYDYTNPLSPCVETPVPIPSADGRMFALCYSDGYVEFYASDAQDAPRYTLFESSYKTLAVAYSGDTAALCGYGGSVTVFDLAAGRIVQSIPMAGMMQAALAFSPDGSMLIVLDLTENAAYVLSVVSGATLMRLDGGAFTLASVAFSADGRTAVASDASGNTVCGTLLNGVDALAAAARALYGAP